MSGYVYPTLPGLTFDVIRTPMFDTGEQKAMSKKRSVIAYMQYPLIHFELTYSLLRDDVAISELKQLVGLFMAMQGKFDTFLFLDPDFNSVINQQFAIGDGVTKSFQITAA